MQPSVTILVKFVDHKPEMKGIIKARMLNKKLLSRSSVKELYFTHKFINELIWADVKPLLFKRKFITLNKELIKGEKMHCVCEKRIIKL